MKKLPIAVLNGIVAAICAIAIIGYFLFPVWTFSVKVTFNQDLADIILENMDTGSESDAPAGEGETSSSDDDEMTALIINELAKENISIGVKVSINTSLLMSTALSKDTEKAKAFLLDLIDDLLETLDNEVLKDLEKKVAKVGVSAAVKISIAEVAKEQGLSSEELQQQLNDAGLSDEFIGGQTDKLIDAIYAENATVDSVTETVVDVVKDSYTKMQDSGAFGEDMEDLTDEDLAEIEDAISEVLKELADENGNLNGDGLLSSLIAGLLAEDSETYEEGMPDLELPEESGSGLAPHRVGVSNAILNFASAPADSSSQEQKSIADMVRDELTAALSDELLDTVRIVAIGLFAFIAFSAFWWIYLLIKLLCKLGMKNPLIKVRMAILLGGLPYVILALIPTIAINLISNPTGPLATVMGAETAAMIAKLFGGAIEIKFASSGIIAFICTIVLFIFGFPYSSRRRHIRRENKRAKREAKRRAKEQKLNGSY